MFKNCHQHVVISHEVVVKSHDVVLVFGSILQKEMCFVSQNDNMLDMCHSKVVQNNVFFKNLHQTVMFPHEVFVKSHDCVRDFEGCFSKST